MKIVIFGASGKLGKLVVKEGLKQGHRVTAFVRNPQKIDLKDKNLTFAKGDIYNSKTVEQAIKGQNVVISALGMPLTGTKLICADGIGVIIPAMKKNKVKKLIAISAFGAGETKSFSLYTKMLRLPVINNHMVDKDQMEREIRKSKLDWVMVRPAAYMDIPYLKNYKIKKNLKGLYPIVSRSAVADFMIKQVTSDKYIHQTPAISF